LLLSLRQQPKGHLALGCCRDFCLFLALPVPKFKVSTNAKTTNCEFCFIGVAAMLLANLLPDGQLGTTQNPWSLRKI
jgi:hypothetical protein